MNKKVPNKAGSESSHRAFGDVVQALEKDMPVLMHGSGDVQASMVNEESVRLLSELTADYIGNLVHAAVDAHELLNGGPRPLPPPPLPRSRTIRTPRPYEESKEKDAKSFANKIPEIKPRKRRRTTDEFWDEPLPEPKIRNKPVKSKDSTGPKFEGVPVDEWIGLSGVDFFENSRTRSAHVLLPAAIGTQSFIFPVCHDGSLYGKVLEVQTARRNIVPLLADPVIQDAVRNESNLQGPGGLRKLDKKSGDNADDQEPEDTDSEDEGAHGATWPGGLESLLPFHTTADFAR